MSGNVSGAGAAAGASASVQPDNTLTINASGGNFTGWQTIRVTRRLEGCPNDFEVTLTERYPTNPARTQIKPGDPCTVVIGGSTVITGYVDRLMMSISGTAHTVRVQGRGKCQDLVDCSITGDQLKGLEIQTTSLLDLANKLGSAYGITTVSLTGDNVPVAFAGGAPVQFNAVLTETPFEIIERVARYAGVLAYETSDGNLTLANVGAGQHSSGLSQGVNVEAASVNFSIDERFQQYLPVLMSVNAFGDQGVGGMQFPKVFDNGVARFRQIFVVSEQFQFDQSLAEKRAQWEAARRKGRSQAIRVNVDSWRDSAGLLWQPNYYVSINLPALKITPNSQWIISDVNFMVDQQSGTHADLLLMPKEAFQPEPILLRPDPWDPTSSPIGSGGATK